MKMGVYRGRPTGVSPHVTTGRADYFGPFVNRFASACLRNTTSQHLCACWRQVIKSLSMWSGSYDCSSDSSSISVEYGHHMQQCLLLNVLERTLSNPLLPEAAAHMLHSAIVLSLLHVICTGDLAVMGLTVFPTILTHASMLHSLSE